MLDSDEVDEDQDEEPDYWDDDPFDGVEPEPDPPDWDEWPGTAPGCAALCNCPACLDPLLVDLLWQHLPPEPDPDPTRPHQNEGTD